MSRLIANAIEKTVTCPNCGQRVKVHVAYGAWTCPLCGHKEHSGGSDTKEGRRMAKPSDVTNLLREASRAETGERAQELVAAAEDARGHRTAQANAARELDLANAVISDHLTPVAVHEHHTAATDWVGSLDTSGGAGVAQEMVAQGSLWYGGLHEAVKADPDEFAEQARGWARRTAGAFGEQADAAEVAFLAHVGTLRGREVRAGRHEGASGVPQVGEAGNPAAGGGLGVGPSQEYGLPGDLTSSNRAPAMQAMEGPSWDPVLPQANPDAANGDEGDRSDDTRLANTGHRVAAYGIWDVNGEHLSGGHHSYQQARRALSRHEDDQPGLDGQIAKECTAHEGAHPEGECPPEPEGPDMKWLTGSKNHERNASMQHVACPSCAGRGRVPVRAQAASGLDQIDQIVDPHDNPSQTPYPTEVAFEWEMDPANQGRAIQETESQLAQREQLKGASRAQVAERAAHMAAQAAYRQVMAGQDDSGWAGDMGAGGNRPGMQDTGNPGPPDSLGYTDPVYGQGGDQGQRDLMPYGEDEADDYTNNPGMNWQPGQPTQADVAGRPNTVGQPTAGLRMDDPEVQRALKFATQRSNLLNRR